MINQQTYDYLGVANQDSVDRSVEELLQRVNSIIQSEGNPLGAFSRIKAEVLPAVDQLRRSEGEASATFIGAGNYVGRALWDTSLRLHNSYGEFDLAYEAARLAQRYSNEPQLRDVITKSMPTLRERAASNRLIKDLKPVTHAPPLFTMNGFGTKLYGNTSYDKLSNSSMQNLYIVFLFIPVFPIARYRVQQVSGGFFFGRYRFFGKAPLRREDKIHQLLFGLAFLFFSILLGMGILTDTSQPPLRPAPRPAASPSRPAAPSQQPPLGAPYS